MFRLIDNAKLRPVGWAELSCVQIGVDKSFFQINSNK